MGITRAWCTAGIKQWGASHRRVVVARSSLNLYQSLEISIRKKTSSRNSSNTPVKNENVCMSNMGVYKVPRGGVRCLCHRFRILRKLTSQQQETTVTDLSRSWTRCPQFSDLTWPRTASLIDSLRQQHQLETEITALQSTFCWGRPWSTEKNISCKNLVPLTTDN